MSSDSGLAAHKQGHGDGSVTPTATPKRAAVVLNPTKVHDQPGFVAAVERVLHDHGWSEPLWLETTAEDPGRSQARRAVEAGVDLVVSCGGDGTVTACAEGIAGSKVPLAILPMGTGNLLARKVGLPAHWREALAVAVTGTDKALDAGTVNGRSFVVMAGLGLDARMLRDTSEPLKRRLGWAAYAVSVLRHLGDRPIRVTVSADRSRPRRLRASAVIVGNVGWLRGGVPLMPDARPDDGLLDAVVLNARGVAGWLALAAQVIMRRGASSRLTRIQFTELLLDVDRAQPWELDGEFMGETRQLAVMTLPGRLMLRLPTEREDHTEREQDTDREQRTEREQDTDQEQPTEGEQSAATGEAAAAGVVAGEPAAM